jgi:MFS family permease
MRWIMSPGLLSLVLGYTLSQFYRAFLAVLSPTLQAELGAGPADLALSSGLWYIAFAAMQLPVGWALDRWGPREAVSVLLALGGAGGATVFALAQAPWHIHLAMALLGVGCAPVMIGSFFILATCWARRHWSEWSMPSAGARRWRSLPSSRWPSPPPSRPASGTRPAPRARIGPARCWNC